ncbi:MAG: anhydro-N-acetylmuramic acid kinase [Gammaproteobacteria bacterium]|nr:anhydro-N-acetylmuramic acid kinase [Gammaproteobacteria bacterium]
MNHYIGLISGTSLDAIDAVLVDFDAPFPQLIHALNLPIPDSLHSALLELCQPGDNEIERMGRADVQLGERFAEAVRALLAATQREAGDILAIGSHGQTIRHLPALGFSLQIGDPNRITQLTGITTVADFRRRDMAAGGQGAPLVCAFHAAMFSDSRRRRAIVNIGGIANATLLPAGGQGPVSGFDTGPGNGLMDLWIQRHQQQPYDTDGTWAASGEVNPALLATCLEDGYFAEQGPKSTGREHFNGEWLRQCLSRTGGDIALEDVQATLCELTATTIAQATRDTCDEVIVCGGGAYNAQLMKRLAAQLGDMPLHTTDDLGLPAQWVEAVAFAWLARETLAGRPGNVPTVTGADGPVVLGAVYPT